MANTTCPAGSLRYSWRSGDTLVRIATAFGTTVSAMRDINPDIDFTKITAGTDVCIPTRMLTCPDSDLYAIQKGDTLSALAAKYGVTTARMLELNPYVEPTQLAIGQYICVPKTTPSEPTCPEGECCVEPEPAPDCNMLRKAQSACSATDTVQCGQTLADILTKYGMSFAEFSYLNPTLVYSALLPGQKYQYPLKACNCSASGRYRVQSGDTIAKIAAGLGITASELLRRNPNLTPSEFVAGTQICVTYPE